MGFFCREKMQPSLLQLKKIIVLQIKKNKIEYHGQVICQH